uniref:L-arabinose isomerase family protein n=1 Tax=Lentzea aerocolonigenes TaxID=68170 RepID=UPI0004C46E46
MPGKPQIWFLTGSQHLYGPETLDQVAAQSQQIQRMLSDSGRISTEIVWKPVLTDSAAIRAVMQEANNDPSCVGVIAWMVAGHASDPHLAERIDGWARAAAGVAHLRSLKLARFGDNMRDVAVTEGDKVEAELGLAVQRLMADGYGFGGEGDWKTSALLAAVKAMGTGTGRGTSFMEDYTYHFGPGTPKILGAHMLEVCPTIAADQPSCEIHPLGIGDREDPVRLVFDATPGPAVVIGLADLG